MNYFETLNHYNRIVKLLGSKKGVRIVVFDTRSRSYLEFDACESTCKLSTLTRGDFNIILDADGPTPYDISERTEMHLKGEYEIYKSAIPALLTSGEVPDFDFPFIAFPLKR